MLNGTGMRRSALSFVLPLIVLLFIFMVYPTVSMLYLAFTRWNGFSPPSWNGIQNFTRLFNDKSFHASLKNLAILVCYIPIWTILPLFFAELIRQPKPGSSFFRSTVLIPFVISPVILGMLFKQLLGVEGLVNEIIIHISNNPDGIGFLTNPRAVIHVLALITIFKFFGFGAILYYGAMSKISESLYESAEMDGCTWLQTLRHVTVPGINHTIGFFIVLGFVTFVARMFPLTFTLTKGGPGYASFVPEFGIYFHAFENSRMGYASTWALFVYLLTLIVIVIQNTLMMKEDK
ncbi:MAG: sugar ABC transporter permease [Bacteroidetes bacterium]|nr:sugar ABC transporter permease [Bacteroidota bacterium]